MNLIIKGFIIGLGKIIPGVSGSMLAMSLGIYEKIIENLSDIKNKIFDNSKFLIKISLGIILSIMLISKMIVKCLEKYYFTTMLLFIGLIIGGMPPILKKIKLRKTDTIISLLAIIIIYIILNPIQNINHNHQIQYNAIEVIKITGIGFIDAMSSIIPGISGTALLLMLGYYYIILESFGNILNISYLPQNIFILLPFGTGFILGLIIVSKIINILFKKYKNISYLIITVLTTISVIELTKGAINYGYSNNELIIGMILFILGIFTANKLE